MPTLILAIGLGLATATLSWLGYRASQEWQKSARLVEERRADEVTTLLSTALNKDMRGAQQSILVPFQTEQLGEPYDISDIVARAFAQFPYPESFFVWMNIPRQMPPAPRGYSTAAAARPAGRTRKRPLVHFP